MFPQYGDDLGYVQCAAPANSEKTRRPEFCSLCRTSFKHVDWWVRKDVSKQSCLKTLVVQVCQDEVKERLLGDAWVGHHKYL